MCISVAISTKYRLAEKLWKNVSPNLTLETVKVALLQLMLHAGKKENKYVS